MTSKLIHLFAIVLLTALAAGCSKKVNKAEGLTGRWEWKSTDGGLAAHIHQTPATTGKTEQLRLSGTLQYFRYTNNVLTEEGTYHLSERYCIHDQKLKTVILFSGNQEALMVENVDEQQLVLSDENYDGLTLLYERNDLMDN